MGYRSDVRIVVTKEGFDILNKIVSNKVDEMKKEYDVINLLNELDIIKRNEKYVYLGWNYVKWYEGYPDVDIIMKSLDELEEKGYGYNYAIIGEAYDDIEEIQIDGNEEDYIECPYIIREFDDDYFEEDLENTQTETKIKTPFEIYNSLSKEQLNHLHHIEIINSIKTYNWAEASVSYPSEDIQNRILDLIENVWLKDEQNLSLSYIADKIVKAYAENEVSLETLENSNRSDIIECICELGSFSDLEVENEDDEEL